MTDYQPLLARALKGLDRNTSEARRAVYDRARQALLNQLRSATPPMADADITRERLALEDAIRKTETEAVLAEPHTVRPPSAARMPSGAPRAPVSPASPASPSARPSAPSPRIPLGNNAQPRIPTPPPSAPQSPKAAPPPPPESRLHAPETDEEKAASQPGETLAPDTPGAYAPSTPPPAAPAPRAPLPSSHPLRTRATMPGNGPRPPREPHPENAPGSRPAGLPSPEQLEELKADFESSPSPLSPPARRFERPRRAGYGERAGDFPQAPLPPPPPSPPPGMRPRPRPPGPGRGAPAAKVKPPKSNLWKFILAGVAALLIVAAGVFAFTLRGRMPGSNAAQSPASDSDTGKTSERITQSQDGGRTSAPSNLDPAVAQRAVLYEENPGGGQQFQNFVGTAVWKTEAVNAPGRAPDLGLRIESEIPERKISVTLKMRRNTDPSFPASHTIEVIFDVPPGDAFGGVADMRGIRAKGGETAQGTPLAAEVQKVKEGYFLLALPTLQQDANLSMLRDRDWLDIPFVYANGRRAVLTFQKGTPGERALREVLNSWGQGQQTGSQ